MATHTHALRAVLFAAALFGAIGLSACGNDERRETQPSPDVTTFTSGEFDDLPRPPRSEEAGERTEVDGVVAQSFLVENTSPAAVLEFYRTTFAETGVAVVSPPEQIGVGTWRGMWRVGDRDLLVSATQAPTTTESDKVQSQFSLELSPAGDDLTSTTSSASSTTGS